MDVAATLAAVLEVVLMAVELRGGGGLASGVRGVVRVGVMCVKGIVLERASAGGILVGEVVSVGRWRPDLWRADGLREDEGVECCIV